MASEQLFKGGVEIQGGQFLLKVSRDGLIASVIPKDHREGVPLDRDKLLSELEENGISTGVLPQPEPENNGGFCVARGIEPIQGENARMKMHVKPAVVHVPKQMDPDHDKVDFRELGAIVNVQKDRLLVEKIPPTLGRAGQDVFGGGIPAKPGKDSKLKYGKGVRLSEDGTRLFAELDGKFVLIEGKPSVYEEHIVSGDVDLSVGNLVFAGKKLQISGEVLPGFTVKCRGDIVIEHGVNNSLVMAGGSLTALGGVVGEQAVLRARGDMIIDFAGNGPQLETAGNLLVNDFLVQIEASVGKNIIATKGKGTIIGGKLTVAGSVHANELGSEAEIVTEVSVGVVPSLQEKKGKLDEDLALWSGRLNEVLKNIGSLSKMKKEGGANFPADKAELLKKCQVFMPKAMERVNRLTEADEALAAELEQMVNEAVYVYDKLWPGVLVRIGGLARTISREEDQVVIFFDKPSHQIVVRKMSAEERSAMPGED